MHRGGESGGGEGGCREGGRGEPLGGGGEGAGGGDDGGGEGGRVCRRGHDTQAKVSHCRCRCKVARWQGKVASQVASQGHDGPSCCHGHTLTN